MTPEEEKNIEKEVRDILGRWLRDFPEWDDMSRQEKASLFAEIRKEHKAIWDSFSFKQKRWLMRQMGVNRWLKATPGGLIGLFLYLLLARPKLGCAIFIVIALALWIVVAVNGGC